MVFTSLGIWKEHELFPLYYVFLNIILSYSLPLNFCHISFTSPSFSLFLSIFSFYLSLYLFTSIPLFTSLFFFFICFIVSPPPSPHIFIWYFCSFSNSFIYHKLFRFMNIFYLLLTIYILFMHIQFLIAVTLSLVIKVIT